MGLILAHGFFVAGEFGIVTADRRQIEQLASTGHGRALSTLKAQKTLSFQLSGAQLGITLTSLLVGFLIEPAVAPLLDPVMSTIPFVPNESSLSVAIAVAFVLATSVEMAAAELIPKNLALAKPLPTAFATATALRLFNAMFKPLIVLLNAAANWSVRRLGIEPRDELTAVHSLEELQVLIRSSREGGLLPEEDFSLLSRSIRFAGKRAADALVPRTAVQPIADDATLQELKRLAFDTGHSRFPVTDGDLDHVVGVAHIKDIYGLPPSDRSGRTVMEIMRPPLFVPESRTLRTLLLEMRRERIHLATVLDEYGATSGIVTLEDILEELVGEIEDEYDVAIATDGQAAATGVYVVSGMLHPDEVYEQTGLGLPPGDYDTLAGFLLTLFDRIPSQGDHTSYERWELKVIEMDGRRIARVLIVRPPEDVTEEHA